MKLAKKTGKKLKLIRDKEDVTRLELEKKTGIKVLTIKNMEDGKNSTLSTVEKIAKGLRYDTNIYFEKKGN